MFGKAIIAVALAAVALAQELKVNSPASLIVCQPALLSWSGGTAPYFVAAIPGGQPSAAALKDFGQQSGTSLTWNVDLAAGTSVTIKITDSTGATNYNSAVTIQPGSSTSCLNAAASGSGSASGAAASASSATGAAGGAVTSGVSAATAMTSSAAGMASSAAGMASSAKSAASSGVMSAASAAQSGASNAASAARSAASGASSSTPSGAASPFAVAPVSGAVAVVLAAIGLVW